MLPIKFSFAAGLFDLKLFDKNDFSTFQSIYGDDELMKFIGPAFNHNKLNHLFHKLISPTTISKAKGFIYKITTEQKTIGILGLKPSKLNQASIQTVEFGVILLKNSQGKGLSQLIKQHLLAYLFEVQKLHKAMAYCDVNNAVANHVNKKIGMKLVATENQIKHNRRLNLWSISKRQYQQIHLSRQN
jgi:RimJ/RimL family protein N-acetyltransferase